MSNNRAQEFYLYLPLTRMVVGPFPTETDAESRRGSETDIVLSSVVRNRYVPRCPTCRRPLLKLSADDGAPHGEIPTAVWDQLCGYLARDPVVPESWLGSLIVGDLFRTFALVPDEDSKLAIPAIIAHLEKHAPSVAWGAPGSIREWTRYSPEQRARYLEATSVG